MGLFAGIRNSTNYMIIHLLDDTELHYQTKVTSRKHELESWHTLPEMSVPVLEHHIMRDDRTCWQVCAKLARNPHKKKSPTAPARLAFNLRLRW